MDKKRPVNLDLSSLKFPPMAIASILHRISGVVLFLLLPILIFLLGKSLHSEIAFAQVKTMISNPYYKFILWTFSAAMSFHILAGIRHIAMDMGVGEHLNTGRWTSILVITFSIVIAIFLGIWIW